jgi:predicted RNase H-like HicB family nuclease
MKNVIVTVEDAQTNYCAYIDILQGCISTGDTIEELVCNMHEAVEFHLEGTREDGDYIHPDFDGEYQLVFQFDEIPKLIKQQYPKRVTAKTKKRELVNA